MIQRDKELLDTIESCLHKLGLESSGIMQNIKDELEIMKD